MNVGSLCSGYGGLDMGLELAVGPLTHAFHVEYDKAPATVLAQRWPGVPNYGDLTTVDWTGVEAVDWLTAGYPCQPFSHAGKRKGAADVRHLWPHVARAVSVLRPRRVLLENVAGHVSLGLDAVLGDLATLGYDCRWGVVRAADAGAPHGRARVFVVAADTCGERHGRGQDGGGVDGVDGADARGARQRQRSRPELEHRSAETPADTCGRPLAGTTVVGNGLRLATERRHGAPADATGDGRREGRAEPARLIGRPDAPQRRDDAPADTDGTRPQRSQPAPGHDLPAWGAYEPAVRRWEHILGREAPRPTELGRNGPRLSPRFVEWMQGLPDGWVTDILGRNAALKALGNGVVPQQAALALRLLTCAEAVA